MSDDIIPKTPSADDYSAEPARGLIDPTEDPLDLLKTWLAEARGAEPNDSNAMSLATVDEDGLPDVRIVLLKGVGPGGLTFFTNYTSEKGRQLAAHPKAALCFHWKSLRRQVRVRGEVERAPDTEADAYFATRSRMSQIGAWASDQSAELAKRSDLEEAARLLEDRYSSETKVPRPEHWGGFRLAPQSIEFWQDQPYRLHDRVKYDRDGEAWRTVRLYP